MRALERFPATILILVAIVSVQAGAALAKSLFAQFGAVGTVYLRVLFAAIILWLLVRPGLNLWRQGRWKIIVVFGAVLVGMNAFYYLALERLPLGLTVTIEFFGPLGVALWQSRRPLDLLWVALAAGGIILLNPLSGALDSVGLIFAVIAGACWAAYILLGQRIGGALPGAQGLTLSMIVGALLMTPLVTVPVLQNVEYGFGILFAIGVAFLSSVVPYTLEIEALRRMPTRQFGILMSLEPAVASVIGWLMLSEQLTLTQWAAVVLVMSASYGVVRFGKT